ncbi:MAG: fumarylacetoacetate hydrolase family protein, partial [Anaerolineae bacterium]|nr:fumarylacetoacetate hydrolase family protein [Anaerolineae bacterium]
MRLVSFYHNKTVRLGALVDSDMVIDLAQAVGALPQPPLNFPSDMLGLLQAEEAVWSAVHAAVDSGQAAAAKGLTSPFIYPIAEVKPAPPLTNPSKIICVGLNYHDHCRETNTPVPDHPVTFVKYPSAIIGPEQTITWPAEVTTKVDYEAELALVIKRTAHKVSPDEAYDYIAGYTILNDISARDVQFSDGQWVRAKSFDTFCPLGPALVTSDEVGDPHQLAIRCRLNGQAVQDSNSSELIFKIPELMAFI